MGEEIMGKEEERPMKSAVELALERTARFKKEAEEAALPEEKRKRIAEIENEYRAKVAEAEILLEEKVKKALHTLPPKEARARIEARREEYRRERESLNRKKILEIERVKGVPQG